MTATPVTTIPNRPTGKPIFDFQIGSGYCRAALSTVSNDGASLVVSGWAYLIDTNGLPVLDPVTATVTGTSDSTNTIALSGVMSGTHSLYDGWCKYVPASGQAIDADNLPEGWTGGSGDPATPDPAPAYGTGYYDTAAQQGWTWNQGELTRVASGYANALAAQIDTAAKLAALGLTA
jgi:hypothetical protein